MNPAKHKNKIVLNIYEVLLNLIGCFYYDKITIEDLIVNVISGKKLGI